MLALPVVVEVEAPDPCLTGLTAEEGWMPPWLDGHPSCVAAASSMRWTEHWRLAGWLAALLIYWQF